MKLAGWMPLEETLVQGRRRFIFEKAGETCHVSIWEHWGTKLLVQVFPTGARPLAVPDGEAKS
jgi:hypothetical protein